MVVVEEVLTPSASFLGAGSEIVQSSLYLIRLNNTHRLFNSAQRTAEEKNESSAIQIEGEEDDDDDDEESLRCGAATSKL